MHGYDGNFVFVELLWAHDAITRAFEAEQAARVAAGPARAPRR